MPHSRSYECYLDINRLEKQSCSSQVPEHHVYACLVMSPCTLLMPFYLVLSGHGESNIPFFPASMTLALVPFLCLSAPSCPSHSCTAENSSLTFSNKKHTLQVSSRGHLHASVIGQTRSLTFFRSSLLTGWDMTFFLFREKQPPQMFTTPSPPLWLSLFFS